jgi:membrane-bound lytic murein transglycosylase MltF
MRAPLRALVLAVAWLAPVARAEIAVLSNGQTLKVVAWRFEGSNVTLRLKDGGEIGTLASLVRGFVPDEVLEELAIAERERPAGDLDTLLRESAQRHGLDPALLRAVVSVESNFKAEAVSPKGAQGLMQLMPSTAASLGVRDAFDPADNVDGGSRHLASLLASYGGDLKKALAAYNAGAGAVARHGGVPPYRETREYVERVLKRYRGGS